MRFKDALFSARDNRTPLLAFNILDLSSLLGVLEASKAAEAPVICQYSSRTVALYGARTLAQLTRLAAARAGTTAFVHLDHCTDASILSSCLDAEFDGVMFDGSALPMTENIEHSLRWRSKSSALGIVLEAEYSAIAGEEDGHGGASNREDLDEAAFTAFIDSVSPDIVGADIGTHHGHYTNGEPSIDFALVHRLSSQPKCPFVVHGGSGLSSETLGKLAACGVAKINVSTDLKGAWRSGIYARPEADPLESLRVARDRVRDLCASKWDSLIRRQA